MSALVAYRYSAQETTGGLTSVLNALHVKLSDDMLPCLSPINICLAM
jgi:hypothetical protein